MSQNKLAKLRNTDVFKSCMRVLEEYRIPKEDFEVLDKRPHPMLTVRYCGVEKMMSLPSTPKTKGRAPTAYAQQLRRLLKGMQMESLGGGVEVVQQEAGTVQQDVKSVVVAGSVIHQVEYRGQQVVTFAMVDEVHQRPDGTAGRVYRENRARFVEGEDFFLITAAESDAIRRFGIHVPNRGLMLLTRRGYLKLVKPMTDDRAWQVQGEMIERYFAAEQAVAITGTPMDSLSAEVRSIIGGIVKSIVHSELAKVLRETADLREQVTGMLIGSDPRVAVLEYVSVAQLLEEGRAVQKGRRSLNQRIGYALQTEVLNSGKPSNRRRCPHSGKWLFQRDFADGYMRREGKRLIREHNDRQKGQTFMNFGATGERRTA
jgi:hypothetical protein